LVIVTFVLAIPVALVTTTVRAVISEQAVYDYSVREFDAAATAGIPETELIRSNAIIRDYLVSDSAGPLGIQVTDENGDTTPLFNARETAHMMDVRDLVQAMFVVQIASVVLVLTLGVLMIAIWPTRVIAAALVYGAGLTGILLLVTGALAVGGFDSAWSQFHSVLFANDLWQLDPDTDHLIQMFPQEFWFRASSLIAVAVTAEALLLGIFGGALFLLARTSGEDSSRPEIDRPALPGRAGHARMAPPDAHHFSH
jgi:integral membrane protein (TIGR01906 family)